MKPYYHDECAGITIYHGESLAILSQLEPGSIGALVTDPPYSSGGAFRGDRVQDVSEKYQQSGTIKKYEAFSGDTRDQRSFGYWSALWLDQARRLTCGGGACAIFTDWRQLPTTTDAIQAGGWVWRGIAAWDKTEAARGIQGRMRNQCEYVVWGSNGPMPVQGVPTAGVFTCYLNPKDKEHITAKPVDVMRWIIQGMPAGAILDPFMGSDTTLRAAKDLGRPAIGIELEERNCEIAAKRLQQEILAL